MASARRVRDGSDQHMRAMLRVKSERPCEPCAEFRYDFTLLDVHSARKVVDPRQLELS